MEVVVSDCSLSARKEKNVAATGEEKVSRAD